jgi:hypothetical protein
MIQIKYFIPTASKLFNFKYFFQEIASSFRINIYIFIILERRFLLVLVAQGLPDFTELRSLSAQE